MILVAQPWIRGILDKRFSEAIPVDARCIVVVVVFVTFVRREVHHDRQGMRAVTVIPP